MSFDLASMEEQRVDIKLDLSWRIVSLQLTTC